MNQYRNFPQPNQRSPHVASGRKGPAPIVANPPPSHNAAQIQQQQQQLAQKQELAKRISRKPTDKNVPDGVEDVIVGEGVQRYENLRDVEKRLDAVMMRKRLDVQDTMSRSARREKKMRIWISNTAEGQPWQANGIDPDAFDFNSDVQATYRVKIEGRLLDDKNDASEQDADAMETDGADESKPKPEKPSGQRTKMSQFFRSITVDFDRPKSMQPDQFTQIEWKKPDGAPPNAPEATFDCLEFERKSDENINVTINLYRDEYPERYLLDEPLAALVGTDVDERANVVWAVWEYIRVNNLAADEEKRLIHCDERLRALFGKEAFEFPNVGDEVNRHLTRLPPIQLPYTIRVDKEYASSPFPTVYDIVVIDEDPVKAAMKQIAASPSFVPTLTTINSLDDTLALHVQAIAHSKAKDIFFTNMAKDPVGFIKRWTESQKRDYEVILGEVHRGYTEDGQPEEFRKGGRDGPWGSMEAKESVGLWLARMRPH